MDRFFQIGQYVMIMIYFWTLMPLLLLLLVLPLLRKLNIIANLRGYNCLAAPLIAAFDRILSDLKLIFSLVIIGLCLCAYFGVKWEFLMIGTSDRLLANQIFGVVYVGYISITLPFSIGLPWFAIAKRLKPDVRMYFNIMRRAGLISLIIVAVNYPGEYCWFSVLCSIGYVGGLGFMAMYAVAVTNFNQTPEVHVQAGQEVGLLYFIQVSDVHATFPSGSEPAGGGHTGTDCLDAIATRLTAKNGEPVPRLLLDTGDLVDRGLGSEWDKPLQSLMKIKAEAGVRIVITPGNHDLVPNYSYSDALWAVTGSRFLSPEMDGVRLFKYFSVASELEPELLTCAGESLKELVDAENDRLAKLKDAWDFARYRAEFIQNKTGLGHQQAMRRLLIRNPTIAERVAADFSRCAHEVFPELDDAEWRRLLFTSSPKQMDWQLAYRIWDYRWTDLFPLRLEIAEDNVEILILNGIAREARLAGSARGQWGEEQFGRLKERLSKSEARVLIILHHHAPFRFPIEKTESTFFRLQRWAMLAHDPLESQTLSRLLAEIATTQKQVMVLSGHIHMRSRFGQLDVPTAVQEGGGNPVWILESGALGEPITDVLPSGWMTESGVIEPRLIPRP